MPRDPRFQLDFSINIEICPKFGSPHLALSAPHFRADLSQVIVRYPLESSAVGSNSARILGEVSVLGDTMKQNVHNIERIVRIIVGLAIVSLVFIGPQSAWGWLGLIPLATGIIGWCPPYALFGFSTCKKPD
jgi:hypothetical protein